MTGCGQGLQGYGPSLDLIAVVQDEGGRSRQGRGVLLADTRGTAQRRGHFLEAFDMVEDRLYYLGIDLLL